MKRLGMWIVLIVAAVITAPIIFFVAALRKSMAEAEKWGEHRLPWWSFCNRIEKQLFRPYGPPKSRRVDPVTGELGPEEEEVCSQCGKWHTSVTYVHDGIEEKWCAACWQKHHDPNFVPPQPEPIWEDHCWL